ncbi:unnamed protein product [Urochloa humidicola]
MPAAAGRVGFPSFFARTVQLPSLGSTAERLATWHLSSSQWLNAASSPTPNGPSLVPAAFTCQEAAE